MLGGKAREVIDDAVRFQGVVIVGKALVLQPTAFPAVGPFLQLALEAPHDALHEAVIGIEVGLAQKHQQPLDALVPRAVRLDEFQPIQFVGQHLVVGLGFRFLLDRQGGVYADVPAERGDQQLMVQHRQRVQKWLQAAFPYVVKPCQHTGAAQVLLVPAIEIEHRAVLLRVRRGEQGGARFRRFLQQHRVFHRGQGAHRCRAVRCCQQRLDALFDVGWGEAGPKRLGEEGTAIVLLR